MHLILPFAAPLAPSLRAVAAGLQLPQLRAALARCAAPQRLGSGDEWSLTPPQDSALAQVLGWQGLEDGRVPTAAWAAQQQGLPQASEPGWALVTPAHWSLGTEQVSLLDSALLNLGVEESRAFHAELGELFTSEGYAWHWLAPCQWMLRHAELAELPSAALDRVAGRNVDRWLTPDPRARRLRRLQNEAQMVLHTHPLNAQREARGELTLNGLWCSGTGLLPAVRGAVPGAVPGAVSGPLSGTVAPGLPRAAQVALDDSLRSTALAEDAPAWAAAFEAWDAHTLPHWLRSLNPQTEASLTLCGERFALQWAVGASPNTVPAQAHGLERWGERVLHRLRGWPQRLARVTQGPPPPVWPQLEGL